VFSLGDETSRALVAAALAPATSGAGKDLESSIRTTLDSRSGEQIPVEITMSPIQRPEDGTKGMVLVFRDVTERQRVMEEITHQANRAEALVQVASQLNKEIELGTLLQTVCVTMNRALRSTGTAVFLLDPKDDLFRNRAAYSDVPSLHALEGSKYELRQETLESMVTRERPVVVIRDLQTLSWLPYSQLLSDLKIHTMVIAALFIRDQLMGTLISVFAGNRPAMSEDDIALSMGLADQASTAIENAELFEQVRMGRERQRVLAKSLVEVQESERRHVARELHDQLGQALTGLQFMLEGAKNHTEDARRSDLEEIQKYVGDIMEQTREISLNLRPSMLDDLGLLPTLQWHFERYSKQTGIQVHFHSNGSSGRCPTEVETAAYRIVQEALTNVARYAQVQEVDVHVATQAEVLWIEVLDKGRGFDLSIEADKPTSGLGGMRERAALVGGYLTVASSPNRGTQIVAALPLNGKVLERRSNERERSAGR
jgi:signal transduction histidine kinase